MTVSGNIPPPPGWHPDPYGTAAWRWWDGSAWTQYTSVPYTAPVGGWPPSPADPRYGPYGGYPGTGGPAVVAVTPEESLSGELAMAPWAKRAFVWYLLVIATEILLAWAERSSFRQIFHDIRTQASTGVVQPQIQQTTTRLDLLSPVSLAVSAPFYVLLLIWQYRAARTARLLWLPAARSAGLGVASWFIPVVNFWFPYQALRDCLPPDHPDRGVVGRLWAFFIAALVLTLVTQDLAWAGSPVGFAFAGAATVAGCGFAVFGVRTVRAVAASHRALLDPGA